MIESIMTLSTGWGYPSECAECKQVKALYQVYIPKYDLRIINLRIPKWICLECWQDATSASERR
jgi:hypothetical protein